MIQQGHLREDSQSHTPLYNLSKASPWGDGGSIPDERAPSLHARLYLLCSISTHTHTERERERERERNQLNVPTII